MVFGFLRRKRDHEIKNIHEKNDNSFNKIIEEMKKLRELFENHVEEHHSNRERSSAIERVQSFERSNQSFMNVQSTKSLKNKLTPSQKKVLRLFDSANIPLDYETIANEHKLSIVTVRRHVNDIKKVFDINEMRDIDRGRKVFYIDKKAKMRLKSKK